MIEAIYKQSLNPTAVWIEYGSNIKELNKSTNKITEGLGAGEASEYSYGKDFIIKNTELTPGERYFYRIAATVDSETLYSSVANFVVKK